MDKGNKGRSEKEKVILVTGASSGIGYESARMLAQKGFRVYAAARRTSLMDPLRQYGVTPLFLDVTDEDSMQKAVDTVLEAEGRIDVLINNAGFGYFGPVETVPMEEARKQLEVNVFGLARMCQLVLPAMRAQSSGRIINTASVAGKLVLHYGGWYHVSKYSVEALSDALRMELKPFGVDVSIIEPGGICTNWGFIAAKHLKESTAGTVYEKVGKNEAELFEMTYRSKLLSKPDVVAKAIVRAASSKHPRVRYRTGRFANTLLFFHWLLPARWWDGINRMVVSRFKPREKKR